MRTICIHVTLRNSTKSPSEHDEKQKSSQSGRQREIARFGINAHQHLSVGLQKQIKIKIKILQESGESNESISRLEIVKKDAKGHKVR